jgi:trichohyalin
MKADALAKQ